MSNNIEITKNVYEAFAKGDMETVLGNMRDSGPGDSIRRT